MIERDQETSCYASLCDEGVAYKYLGRFGTPPEAGCGRIEGFLEGYIPLNREDFGVSEMSKLIAREMTKVHKFVIPEFLEGAYGKKSNLWKEVRLSEERTRRRPQCQCWHRKPHPLLFP